jgi:hypothetical protein
MQEPARLSTAPKKYDSPSAHPNQIPGSSCGGAAPPIGCGFELSDFAGQSSIQSKIHCPENLYFDSFDLFFCFYGSASHRGSCLVQMRRGGSYLYSRRSSSHVIYWCCGRWPCFFPGLPRMRCAGFRRGSAGGDGAPGAGRRAAFRLGGQCGGDECAVWDAIRIVDGVDDPAATREYMRERQPVLRSVDPIEAIGLLFSNSEVDALTGLASIDSQSILKR